MAANFGNVVNTGMAGLDLMDMIKKVVEQQQARKGNAALQAGTSFGSPRGSEVAAQGRTPPVMPLPGASGDGQLNKFDETLRQAQQYGQIAQALGGITESFQGQAPQAAPLSRPVMAPGLAPSAAPRAGGGGDPEMLLRQLLMRR